MADKVGSMEVDYIVNVTEAIKNLNRYNKMIEKPKTEPKVLYNFFIVSSFYYLS